MDLYTLNFDGACYPRNPGGTGGWGYILELPDLQQLNQHGTLPAHPDMTNNVMEHYALYHGLRAFENNVNSTSFLQVRGDSMLVINQMNKVWGGRKDKPYFPYYQENLKIVNRLRQKGHRLTFDWIPREENQKCDDLSKNDVDK